MLKFFFVYFLYIIKINLYIFCLILIYCVIFVLGIIVKMFVIVMVIKWVVKFLFCVFYKFIRVKILGNFYYELM